MIWLAKFIHSPVKIGSIAPSSNRLGRLMIKNLNPDAKTLELGAGSGAITKHILSKLNNPNLLTAVESDTELANICQNKFQTTTILNQDIQLILNSNQTFDAIVSGIPFAALSGKDRQQLFHLIHERLAPGGTFIMFQYSKISLNELQNTFGSTKTDFTFWNLPPAFVFTCRKQK